MLDAASRASADAYDSLRDRWFEKLLGPEREEFPTSNHTSYLRRLSPLDQTYTKEQAVPVCVASLAALGLDIERHARDQARPGRPAAEVPARLRHRLRSAERRPSDHARPGRAPRLPGVPARGRACAPLRRRRPGAAVHLPQAVARPRADRDLQLHRGGDLARAGLARRALRALRRAGARECRSDGLPRGAALPPLHGEAPVRARVLGPLQRGRRDGRRLLRAAHRRHRHSLPGGELPLRHGLRLLLGRLPPRLDPLRAAAAASRPRGGGGLVAQPADGRAVAGALPRGHPPDERGDRGPDRLRAAGHRARSCTSSARSPCGSSRLDAVRSSSYLRPESGLRFRAQVMLFFSRRSGRCTHGD